MPKSSDPTPVDENDPLFVTSDNVYAHVDFDGDGTTDAIMLDADGNEKVDIALDTNGDGQFDTLLHDVEVNDDGMSMAYQENINNVEVIPVDEPYILEPEPLVLMEDEVHDVIDIDGDGLVDAALIDADGNDIPDLAADTTGDGRIDTVFHDVIEDEKGDIYYNYEHEVGDVEVLTDDGELTPLTDVLRPDNMASNLFNEEENHLMGDENFTEEFTEGFDTDMGDTDFGTDMSDMI